jgi:hypothetical protein
MRIERIAMPALSSLILALFVATFQFEMAEAQAPKGKPVSIRGKISAVEKQALKVTTSAGEVLVKLPDDVRIGGVEAAQLSDIEAGKYVGTTAVKQADGNLKALEVHIFPDSSRGTGEGFCSAWNTHRKKRARRPFASQAGNRGLHSRGTG